MINLSDVQATGYAPNEYFFASRYKQGGRTVFALDWSVRELVTFLPKPDPDASLGLDAMQRRIVPAHARGFGEYVRNDRGWVSPALLLRAPDILGFDPVKGIDAGTTQFGQLAVPKDAKSEISIVDGQHRTLGFHLAWEGLSADIQKARANLARSKVADDPIAIQSTDKVLNKLLAQREALSAERVSVQIVIVDTPEVARRVFVDINDNAKGITGAVKTRFDDRKVLSRALNFALSSNDLLQGRVDLEQDRVSGTSSYLLGAKHVADILRALAVGGGRITKRLEDELDEKEMVSIFDDFTTTLCKAFPQLGEVEAGVRTPAGLRSVNLIGSNVMLRAFALAWYDLAEGGWSVEEIEEAFTGLNPHMKAPVLPDAEDTWFATGLFPSSDTGSYSPTSRLQDFKALAEFIADACENPLDWKRVTKMP